MTKTAKTASTKTASTKTAKELTMTDKMALKVVETIRADRSKFGSEASAKTADGKGVIRSFESNIGEAQVKIGRIEVPGKKSREVIARAFITVTPKGGKALEITGHLAARAFFALTKVPAVRGKAVADQESVDAAAAALGL